MSNAASVALGHIKSNGFPALRTEATIDIAYVVNYSETAVGESKLSMPILITGLLINVP